MKKILLVISLFVSVVSYSQRLIINGYKHAGGTCPTVTANNGTLDNSGGGSTPSWATDAPASQSGITAYSLVYDGAYSRVSMASDLVFTPSGSISLWFKATSFPGVIAGNSGNGDAFIYCQNSTTIYLRNGVTGNDAVYTVPTMSTGTWYNLIFVRSGGTSHCYLDGTESGVGVSQPSNDLHIDQFGKYYDNISVAFGLNWVGKITNVVFWDNYALTSTDISNIQSGTYIDTYPACITHWYKTNENSGLTLNDTHH